MRCPPKIFSEEISVLLKNRYSYNPETGIITSRYSGKPIGKLDKKNQYLQYTAKCRTHGKIKFNVHRLAWFLHYREWPTLFIDHINHNKIDNRISNLRLATFVQNNMNTVKYATNKGQPTSSKHKGVSFDKRLKKYKVTISVNGKSKYLGLFTDELEAANAYAEAAREFFGEFAHVE